jgi:hypothetical protein
MDRHRTRGGKAPRVQEGAGYLSRDNWLISLEPEFRFFSMEILGRKIMKPYPLVDDLHRPSLRVAMPRAMRSAVFLSRNLPSRGRGRTAPCLRTPKFFEAERWPVPLSGWSGPPKKGAG